LDLWHLVRSFGRLNRETVLDVPVSIIYDNVPLERFIENILKILKQSSEIFFSKLISNPKDRFNIVKNFLATLELVRQNKVEVKQENDLADILIKRLEGTIPTNPTT
jgi:segregation and condensation protein A